MHDARPGKPQRLTGSAFVAYPQREVLALDLLHPQLPYRVPGGGEMSPIDTGPVRVPTGDAQGGEQGAEFEEPRVLPGTDDVREHSAWVMSDRLPQPPRGRLGAAETPHFLHFGGAPWSDANGGGAWARRREHRGGDGLKRGDFFLTRRSRSWD
jgi:hypothetical protein